jgi:two-component system, LuxR family, response regulator FixJ
MQPEATIYIVDDDEAMRKSLALLLEGEGFGVKTYPSGKKFLENSKFAAKGCVLLDVRMPGIDGLELQQLLPQRGIYLPIVMITGHGDVPMAVQAMKTGAKDFIEKPFRAQALLDRLQEILAGETNHPWQFQQGYRKAASLLARLSQREHQVFELLTQGKMNKHIAAELHISIRTAEAHRARIMQKLKAKSIADLVRLAVTYGTQQK